MNPLRLRVALGARRAARVRPAVRVRPACVPIARRFESTATTQQKHGSPSLEDLANDLAAGKIESESFNEQLTLYPDLYHDPDNGHHDDHHHEHHEHDVKEPLGFGFWTICAVIPSWMLVYNLSQPDAHGNLPAITRVWADYQQGLLQHWKTQSDMQNAVIQEAGHERHLLYYAPRPASYDLNYPEVFDHGSRRSVPAGHYINLDQVKEHYRKQYTEEEERKANRLRSQQGANSTAAPKEKQES